MARGKGDGNYTDTDRMRFLKLLRKNYGNVSITCRKFEPKPIKGGAVTIRKWREKYAWFDEAYQDILEEIIGIINDNGLELAVKKKRENMIKFYMTHHPVAKKRYNFSSRTEIGSVDNNNGGATWADIVLNSSSLAKKRDSVEADNLKHKKKKKKKKLKRKVVRKKLKRRAVV